jgi:predicted Co/Zn/Cd cation transporter (cation efflux family)
MAAPSTNHVRRTLRVTIAVTVVLGALGVTWGIAVGSQMILLDGVFALIEVALTALLLRAASLAVQGPTRNFPYGRESATPLVIGIYGFVLAGTLVYAAVQALATIRAGGSDVTAGWGIAFGVITAAGSLGTWIWLRSTADGSDLLATETAAWRVSAFRGLGIVVGFTLMALLVFADLDGAARHVDPVMVLITCVAFVPTPLRMIRTTVVELLEGNPAGSIREAVELRVDAVREEFGLDPLTSRVTKVGPKLYVEIEGEIDGHTTIDEEHRVRQRLFSALDELSYDIWLNVEFLPHGHQATGPDSAEKGEQDDERATVDAAPDQLTEHIRRRPRWWPIGVGAATALVVGWAFATASVGIMGSNPAYLITLLLALTTALGVIGWAVFVGPAPPRPRSRIWIPRVALLAGASALIGLLVALRPLSADQIAIDALADGGGVAVEVSRSTIRLSSDAGPRSVGLAFYPGARVDPQAYAHILRPIVEAGFEVVIFKQPYNLAILDSNAADAVIGDPDDAVDQWVVAGHSLGGAMASRYAERERDELVGLLLYAAYPVTDMSGRTNLTVMSVFGTADGIADPADIEDRVSDLPPATAFVAIDGAIHSFFGDYGTQRGDGTPGVSRQEAQDQVADASIRLLSSIETP